MDSQTKLSQYDDLATLDCYQELSIDNPYNFDSILHTSLFP